jgi:hypothetical protein
MRDIERKPFHKRLRHAGGEALTAPLKLSARPAAGAKLEFRLAYGENPERIQAEQAAAHPIVFRFYRLPPGCPKLAAP